MRRWALLALLVGASGCYRVPVEVEPLGAVVVRPNRGPSAAPTEVSLVPFGRRRLTVTAANHRPLEITVRWRFMAGFVRRTHAIEVRLAEDHGPAGSRR